ncbi:MAG: CHAP domain-containing protein, partial [Ktedonobacterales bacterium]
VDAVPANPRELTSAATGDTAPVTVILRTVELPAVWSASIAPRPRRRGVRSTLLIWALACAAVLAVISAATPLTMRLFAQPFVPSAARMALNLGAAPSGPWASVSGAVQTLGVGGGAGPGVTAPGTAGLPVQRVVKAIPTHAPSPPSTSSSSSSSGSSGSSSSGISPAPVSPWPPADPYMFVPGHGSFAMQSNGYYSWAFGQCTWWAQWERRDENLTYMGNAMYWASSAAARGYRVGGTPAAGATVVFQPGVQGAGGAGHVAHVVAVYPGGWFLVSEMNFYWNGGGWGRVDYRFAHTGWGVQFIY